ncbi:hypothetical protein RB195_022117 [Necator americanus]|uniref:Uncharacterized protein n=1 Tax=Necator americanus TaxID=51031 RepID=A0ABR1EE00_NECAM
MAGLKDENCKTKFCQGLSMLVGVRTRKKFSDTDSFTMCIQDAARKTLPVLLRSLPLHLYNSVCVARSTGDFKQEKRLRRKLRHQLQKDHEKE